MNISILFVILILPLMFFSSRYKDERKKNAFDRKAIFFLGCLLILFAGLRSESIGSDTGNYMYFFENISMADFSYGADESLAPVYFGLSWVFSELGFSVHWWFAFVEFLYIYAFYSLINRLSFDKLFSFFCFFTLGLYSPSFNIMKQTLALAFALLSFCKLYDKKYIPSIILFVLAFFSHNVSGIFIIVMGLYFIRCRKAPMRFSLIVIVVGCLAGSIVWPKLLGAFGSERYAVMYGGTDELYSSTVFIYLLVLFFLSLFLKKTYDRKCLDVSRFLYGTSLVGVAVQSMATTFSIMHRLVYFFSPFMIITIPNGCFLSESRTKSKIFKLVFVVAMTFFSLYTSRNSEYYFYWQR